MDTITTDTFYNGQLQVRQKRSGYRFSIDAVLLAYHSMPYAAANTVLDLGTGCGIIPLMLAYHHPKVRICGIEIQEELAHIAALNVEENGMTDQIRILCRDMKTLKYDMVSGPVELVVSNPPYRKANSGRINPNQERAIARHEIKATLSDVIETAHRMLCTSGRFVTIYPAERMTDLLTQMRVIGIEPKYLRMIHSERDTEAKLILAQGIRRGRPGIKVGPPLVIYNEDGTYTDEVNAMYKIEN
ncbi:tRNA1(Val) (adenine(37)-N6)-methyltransferase [Desulfonema magnum]|uniref:SAM-dependent methyltransferase domain-containing protein n=1 Tax=Desulfonema magnum TaxID=45655 RepID=A0A975BX33_9BACT|nr:methyltransferase [Desulfonema magnum]QTA92770.1 SAM-dependent methyltransferase domain-containing protein [Desulfonema magnum]